MKRRIIILVSLLWICACESKILEMSSSSMEPTFKMVDHVLINLRAYSNDKPKRWDIVVYQSFGFIEWSACLVKA